MSGSDKKCCVPGCTDNDGKHQVLHIFPNPLKDKDRFETWVKCIGGDILGLDDAHIHKYRRVCHVHFEAKYLCRHNRISKDAIPTINIPVDQCKEAWNKLRNCYNNAIRRRRKRSGQLGKKLPLWRFEEQMIFVKPQLGGHHATNNLDDITENVSEGIPSPGSSKRPESPGSVTSCTSKKSRTSSERDNLGVNIDMMMRNPLEMREKEQELDDLDHFFLSMSKMVKKLPKLDQIRIKLDLHQSITRAEIKQLQAQQNIK